MASGEMICGSYECSLLLSLFVCVKNVSSKDRFFLVKNLRPLMSKQLLKFGFLLYYLNGEYYGIPGCGVFKGGIQN